MPGLFITPEYDAFIRAQFNLGVTQPLQCLGIDAMFLLQDARRKRLFRIVFHDRNSGLNDDRAVIQRRCNKMYGAAVNAYAIF